MDYNTERLNQTKIKCTRTNWKGEQEKELTNFALYTIIILYTVLLSRQAPLAVRPTLPLPLV